jgi:hypothetical protein
MKKLLLTTLSILMMFSCSNDKETDITNNFQKWKYKVNGVQHEWEGDSNETSSWGSSFFSEQSSFAKINLSKVEDPIRFFNFKIPTLNNGEYILAGGNNSSANLVVSTLITYYTDSSHKINFKITNATENKITGTFSGELYRENNMGNPVVVNITEGYFEAIRE